MVEVSGRAELPPPGPSSDDFLSYSLASHQRRTPQLPTVPPDPSPDSPTKPRLTRLLSTPGDLKSHRLSLRRPSLAPEEKTKGSSRRGCTPSPLHQLEGWGHLVMALHSVTRSSDVFTEGLLCDQGLKQAWRQQPALQELPAAEGAPVLWTNTGARKEDAGSWGDTGPTLVEQGRRCKERPGKVGKLLQRLNGVTISSSCPENGQKAKWPRTGRDKNRHYSILLPSRKHAPTQPSLPLPLRFCFRGFGLRGERAWPSKLPRVISTFGPQ